MREVILKELLKSREAKQPVVLATRLTDGIQKLLHQSDTKEENWLIKAVAEVLASDKSRVVEDPDGQQWFLNAFNPPLRLLVVGAVHIAQPVAAMAALAAYDVTVIDPRTAFASPERFPGVTLRTEWPDEAMTDLKPDARTAVITLTHDPKLDDPALVAALNSPAFYIGALGSKKTHAARHERLKAAGFDDQAIARIHGPIGLSIGAKSPA
ncbi:MAG: XdhC family protein, partial [Parvibaculum sp.]|uniref:XdhC family protein n=1 Tax=Parvibaculum sp. TaxID=2024848 RepID=UPI003C718ADA